MVKEITIGGEGGGRGPHFGLGAIPLFRGATNRVLLKHQVARFFLSPSTPVDGEVYVADEL